MDPSLVALFRNSTIVQIQDSLQIKKQEIDTKKDELRHLVGEQHRDVIEASDTIQDMGRLSADVADGIQLLDETCRQWNNTCDNIETVRSNDDEGFHDLSIAAHLKCLLDTPELIWKFMDAGDHLNAGILFFVGRHVSAKFELSEKLSSSQLDVSVFVKRLWNTLVRMESAVLAACRRRLSISSSSSQDVCSSLVTLMLVENVDIDVALKEFLSGRRIALDQLLNVKSSTYREMPLKYQFALVSKFLWSTSEMITTLFDDTNASQVASVSQELAKLSQWTLKDTNWFSDDSLYAYLPYDISNFRFISPSVEPLTLECLRQQFSAWWLESIQTCRSSFSNSLGHVSGLNSLLDMRTSLLTFISKLQTTHLSHSVDSTLLGIDKNYVPPNHSLLQRPIDLWRELFGEEFFSRISHALEAQLDVIFNEWKDNISQLIEHNSSDVQTNSDAGHLTNLQHLVWGDPKREAFLDNDVQSPLSPSLSVLGAQSAGRTNISNKLSQLLQPNNVGLVVFCCLAHRPIPAQTLSTVDIDSRQRKSYSPPAHLIVFLQRLLAAPIDSHRSVDSSDGYLRSMEHTSLSDKLQLLSLDLKRICASLDQQIAQLVIGLSVQAEQDWLALWQILLDQIERLLSRCEEWIVHLVYGLDLSQFNSNTVEKLPLKCSPAACLYVTRAVSAFLDLCPSIGAAVITANGLLRTSKVSNQNESDHEFSWSDVAQLRSLWLTCSNSLRSLNNRMVLDSLVEATVSTFSQDEFRRELISVFVRIGSNEIGSDGSVEDAKTDSFQGASVDSEEPLSCSLGLCDPPNYFGHNVLPFNSIKLDPQSDDSDPSISSTFLELPGSLSLPLHNYLLRVVRTINSLCVHMLPIPVIHSMICLHICHSILDCYSFCLDEFLSATNSNHSDLHSKGINSLWRVPVSYCRQPFALQLIFDIRFVMRLLAWLPQINNESVRSNRILHEEVNRKFDILLKKLEEMVDPFDLQVCSSKLTTSVDQFLQTVTSLYTSLMPADAVQSFPTTTSNVANTNEKTAATLVPLLSTVQGSDGKRTIPRFALLDLNQANCVDKLSVNMEGKLRLSYLKSVSH